MSVKSVKFNIMCFQSVRLDGQIIMNGGNGVGNRYSGGGAGGSVYIEALRLRGYGTVMANGGTAVNNFEYVGGNLWRGRQIIVEKSKSYLILL